jgi:hypothetical protein
MSYFLALNNFEQTKFKSEALANCSIARKMIDHCFKSIFCQLQKCVMLLKPFVLTLMSFQCTLFPIATLCLWSNLHSNLGVNALDLA